ncbi:unnamed protein product [Closterium sp. NIES-64]|nr:unnamed protein product [Closterium sp. NIES-64]
MQPQRRRRESLTPQQLREWYAGWGCRGGDATPTTTPAASTRGDGQMQLPRPSRVSLTPRQLREWYAQSGGSLSAVRCSYVIRTGTRTGQPCGTRSHTPSRCFARLSDAWRTVFGDEAELPDWVELLRQRVDIYALDYDAILTAMYALPTSADRAGHLCVPPDPGIGPAALATGEAAALGASESPAPGTGAAAALGASESASSGAGEAALSGTALASASLTITLDSGASRSFFRDRTTLTPLGRPVAVSLADPSGGPVLAHFSTVLPCPAAPSGTLSGLYLPSFSTNLVSGADLQDAGVHQFTPASQRVTHCTDARTGRHLATVLALSLLSPPGQDLPVSPVSRVASGLLLTPPTSPRQRLPCRRFTWMCGAQPPSVGRDYERYFLLVVDDYSRYTTVLPLRSKGEVTEAESSPLAFCVPTVVREGIRQSFTLPDSPQQNGIAERRIGMVMDVARTSMMHAAAPHFLWPFAVRYAAHQLNLHPRVSRPAMSPALLWTGKVGDASVFRVWGSRAFVRDLSADKLSPRAAPCVFLGFPTDASGWQFYHPSSRRVLSSQDVTFDESVPFYRLFPYRTSSLPPPPDFLVPVPPPVDPLPPQVPAPSGVSQVDAVDPVEVTGDSGAAAGAEPGVLTLGVLCAGVLSLGVLTLGVLCAGVLSLGVLTLGVLCAGVLSLGVLTLGVLSLGVLLLGVQGLRVLLRRVRSLGVLRLELLSLGFLLLLRLAGSPSLHRSCASGSLAAGGVLLSLEVLLELELELLRPSRVRVLPVPELLDLRVLLELELLKGVGVEPGAVGPAAGGVGGAGAVSEGAGAVPAASGAAEPGVSPAAARAAESGGAAGAGAGASSTVEGAGAAGPGAVGPAGPPGAGGTEGVGAEPTAVGPAAGGVGGAGAVAEGAGAVPAESGAAARPRPYFVPLLQQVLGLSPSVECPQPVQSQSLLEPSSPLPAPSPYTGPTGGLAERREPASRPASPVRAARASGRGSRQRPPPVPGTHRMSLRPSTAPLRAPLPSPPESSLPALADPESDSLRAASPTVTRLLATVVTDPSFESTAASALVAELVDFAARCRLDYAAGLVAESASVCPPSVGGECALGTDVLEDRQEELQCLAAASPHLASVLLAPEGDPDALDIPTPRSYAEAVEGPYSSQWQAAMDAEMASWKSTGTYVDAVPPPGANIVSGMWIFRVKRPPGSPPVFKARYVARGFSQRQGVDYFQTFSPTPKMTTLRVLLHIAAQRDYELHSLDFSTAFLQGSLHEEIWLRRPPGFTGTFPPGTQWSLRRPVYGLRQAPREWHDTLRTTLAALGFAPSTADPSLFLRTDTSLPPFYILVYVDDLVFATADTAGLAYVKSELLKRHTCTDLGELRSYLGLQITRDRARRTITLTQSHMVQQVLQRFGFTYSSPQATPLPTRHSLSALPSDESVESSGPYAELTRAHGCSEEGIALPVQYVGHGACAWRAESSGPYRPRGRFLG